jgi:hypothetical protein
MPKRGPDDMAVEVPDLGKRARKPTAVGAEYAAALEAKKSAALARIEAKKARATTQPEIDDLSALLDKVKVADDEDELANLMSGMKMGGRKRRTLKKKGKKSRKTRKN